MSNRRDIDAHLDAALAAQVRAPKLDRQFDAAVWRRIEAGESQPGRSVGSSSRRSGGGRWLLAGNAAGLLVAAVLLVYYGLQLGGAIAPDLAAVVGSDSESSWLTPASWAITAIALAFGLRFTSLGRWLRAEFF